VTPTSAGREVAPRLRIAFVYDALFPYVSGGAERRYHELATRLAERHEVHCFSWGYWGDEPTQLRDGITYHAVGPARPFYGDDGKRTVRETVEFGRRLLPVLWGRRFDVVDASATPYVPLYAAWLATRRTGTPLVATWHEYWGEHWAEYLPDRPAVARLGRLLEAGARPLADMRVAVSAMTARRLGGDVEVVGNGVSVEGIRSAAPDPFTSDVIYVGRLIDEKRVDVLLHAVAHLANRQPGIVCAIVGDGPERPNLEARAATLGITANVRFLGRVGDDRLGGLLKASRVLAMPSEREGYGIAVVEAQAAGIVPVVARSPFSAASDLITDGEDGVLCDPTPAGMAAAIAGVLADEPGRRRMAQAAMRAVAQRSWDDRAHEMEQVYRRAAGARVHEPRRAPATVGAR
jgi:glycosyltransferase involved in cell wall biosynthesis